MKGDIAEASHKIYGIKKLFTCQEIFPNYWQILDSEVNGKKRYIA